MYVGICYSIAEMSPALPHTGGAYSFGRTAMGPWGGFITGLAENVEYVLTPAVIMVGIGGYMGAVFDSLFDIAYGRNIYSLSRSGYFPRWLSLTLPERKTPYVALIAGAAVGYCVALLIEFGEGWFGDEVPVGAVLLTPATGWASTDVRCGLPEACSTSHSSDAKGWSIRRKRTSP